MVSKILAYERAPRNLRDRIVLVADDPDDAGDFVRNAEELSRSILSGLNPHTISLEALGVTNTKREIRKAFDEGSSLMSYLGHGGIHLWANEALFATGHVRALTPQDKKPVLLTMNPDRKIF